MKEREEYRIENTDIGNWRNAWSRETLTSPATSWRLTKEQGDAAQWCSAWRHVGGWWNEWTQVPQSPGSPHNRQGQGLEEVDEEVLQLGRPLIRECIGSVCWEEKVHLELKWEFLEEKPQPASLDVDLKYLMCTRVPWHCQRKKGSPVRPSGAFPVFPYVLRDLLSLWRVQSCKSFQRWTSLLNY